MSRHAVLPPGQRAAGGLAQGVLAARNVGAVPVEDLSQQGSPGQTGGLRGCPKEYVDNALI